MIDFLRKRNNIPGSVNPDSGAVERKSAEIFKSLELSYRSGNRKRILRLPGLYSDSITLQLDSTNSHEHGLVMALTLATREGETSLELQDFSLQLQPGLSPECKMMVNGFQSWSRSEELGAKDRIAPLSFIARPLLAPCGDTNFYRYKGKRGCHHSWTYTYFRHPGGRTLFIGSLNENDGYTLFEYDYSRDSLLIRKDCTGASAGPGCQLLKLYIGWGSVDLLFREFAALTGSTRASAPKAAGWCSWYNYYTSVSEEIIRKNLAELSESKLPLEYFQIDDGWQKAIGDWLECNDKFPSGMQPLCEEIKSGGFRPGLWLAPFICVRSSEIFREKPQWLLRDQRGRPVRAGFNPGWEGFFYALDFYAPGFQDHLSRVFSLVQEQWGYSMLKLDFLYAAALLPQNGRSRGQIMSEAMDFIDQQTRGSKILGCGVPLGPAFGRVDYCRIGSDVGPYWEDYLKLLNYPERVATENSLVCTIGRQHLDGNVFRNDPDVFILRDGIRGINENRLNHNQRFTLFLLNNILGGLIFFSDDLAGLAAGQLQLLRRSYPLKETEITAFESSRGLHKFEFAVGAKSYLAYANLTADPQKINLPGDYFFSPEHFMLQPGASLDLEPYQGICLYRVEFSSDAIFLLGASGHIFPGAQVEELVMQGDSADLKLHSDASAETEVFLGLPPGRDGCTVNGIRYSAGHENDLNYIKVPFQGSGHRP